MWQNVDSYPTCSTIASWPSGCPASALALELDAWLAVAAVVGLCAFGAASPTRRPRPASVRGACALRPTRVRHRRRRRRVACVDPARRSSSARSTSRAALRHRRQHARAVGLPADLARARAARRGAPRRRAVLRHARRRTATPDCADHAWASSRASIPTGASSFVEARGGRVRRSFVARRAPHRPPRRRAAHPQQLPARQGRSATPPDARYFAGEMIAASHASRGSASGEGGSAAAAHRGRFGTL